MLLRIIIIMLKCCEMSAELADNEEYMQVLMFPSRVGEVGGTSDIVGIFGYSD